MPRLFETDYGYFTEDGNEYVIKTPRTPKPWINVISNGNYGLTVSQTSGGFSWYEHSEFNRITRWHQDLIRDNWGKYLYIRDNESGEVWNPGWLPTRTNLDHYECRHGFGYTRFITQFRGIKLTLTFFIPRDVKHEIWQVKIENQSDRDRDVAIISYLEWCLGGANDYHREFHKKFLATQYDSEINGLIATKRIWEVAKGERGHWNSAYPYYAFHACNRKLDSYEGAKENFLGNYGQLSNPQGLKYRQLSKTDGAWNDSIASLQVNIELKPGDEEQLAFLVGLEKKQDQIRKLVRHYQNNEQINNAFHNVKQSWQQYFNTLTVETPDQSINLLVNKWLKYQAVSGRLWARSAYYQQSGAIGFRDQLQDSQIFLPIDPQFTKEQICLHARHQFSDGTVLHWWHPITDEGLKNDITDNRLWLPFVVINYIRETADYDFLDHSEDYYQSTESGSIFEHCCQALDFSLQQLSNRGIPLIGSGDWNDGLNGVGLEGKGESFWLAHFLFYLLDCFSDIAERYGKDQVARRYQETAQELGQRIEKYGWDGAWFMRATKDTGELIGSHTNKAGQVFLNAQSWSVISESVSRAKQAKAMQAVYQHLLKDFGPLLLYPAYQQSDEYIGYLSRYAPGTRENGGVYMHAACWALWAAAKLGHTAEAYTIYNTICPVKNGMDAEHYGCEPYVTPGNIDGPDSPYYGLGGWTWYTGSAAWLQKVIIDWMLGLRATEKGLIIDPCIPKTWQKFKVKRLFWGSTYLISVENPDGCSGGVEQIEVNGEVLQTNRIPLCDQKSCHVKVVLKGK